LVSFTVVFSTSPRLQTRSRVQTVTKYRPYWR